MHDDINTLITNSMQSYQNSRLSQQDANESRFMLDRFIGVFLFIAELIEYSVATILQVINSLFYILHVTVFFS